MHWMVPVCSMSAKVANADFVPYMTGLGSGLSQSQYSTPRCSLSHSTDGPRKWRRISFAPHPPWPWRHDYAIYVWQWLGPTHAPSFTWSPSNILSHSNSLSHASSDCWHSLGSPTKPLSNWVCPSQSALCQDVICPTVLLFLLLA